MSTSVHAASSAAEALRDARELGAPVEAGASSGRSLADPFARACALASQAVAQREGGEALADLGKHAEALLLLRASVVSTREALELLAPAAPPTPDPRLSRVPGLSGLSRDALQPGMALRAQVRRHRAALRGAHAALQHLAATPAQRARARRERLGAIALVVATLVVAGLVAALALRTPKAFSSADLGGAYAAARAVDGDRGSEWLLPTGEAGWLDVHLRPRRHVARVRLVNAKNTPYADRGTQRFRLEGYLDDALVWSSREESFVALGEARELPVGARVSRLRVVVLSWYGVGAGLAEVDVR